MFFSCYSQKNSVADLQKNGVLKSEGVTVLVNDYEGGMKHEKAKPRIVDDPSDENQKCIEVTTNADFENNYDAQLFIVSDEPFKKGEYIKFSVQVKADVMQLFSMDIHSSPGEYVMPLGSSLILPQWYLMEKSFVVEESNLRTIALNLSSVKSGNNCYYREIYLVS